MAKAYKVEHRYMVAHLIGDVRTGETFESWGPHITLLPWFAANEPKALDGFIETAYDMEACRVHLASSRIGALALYGEQNDVPVRLIEGDGAVALGVMHGLLLARFHGRLQNREYIGGLYRPHIALKAGAPDLPEELTVDSLCLIRHDGAVKTIVGAEKL